MRGEGYLVIISIILTLSALTARAEGGGGCCLDFNGQRCINIPSPGELETPDECRAISGATFSVKDCISMAECELHCCCYPDDPITNTQSTYPIPYFACDLASTPEPAGVGDDCTQLCIPGVETIILKGTGYNHSTEGILPLFGASVSLQDIDQEPAVTDPIGEYYIRNVPANTNQTVLASKTGCKDEEITIETGTEAMTLDFTLDCTCTPNLQCGSFLTTPCINGVKTVQCIDLNGCTPPTNRTQSCEGICTANTVDAIVISDLRPITRLLKIEIDWTYDTSCIGQEQIQNTVWRCQGNSCVDIGKTTGTHYLDEGEAPHALQAETEYCYHIESRFYDGSTKESEPVCITSGNSLCFTHEGGEFCDENMVKTCDVNNQLQVIEDCGTGKFCLGPYPTGHPNAGEAECVNAAPCDKCNGLFEMSSYLDYLKVIIGLPPAQELKECTQLLQDKICYKDNSYTIADEYYSCNEIDKCRKYKSKDTCENDPCMKNMGCQWMEAYGAEASAELGLGICNTVPPTHEDCQACNDLLGGCTKQNCQLLGEWDAKYCYFDALHNNLPTTKGCEAKERIICRDYDAQQDCEGAQPFSMDIQYNANNTRIGGTHAFVRSQDFLNFGKCYWNSINEICDKDADGKRAEADCASYTDMRCQQDFEAPVTELSIPTSPITNRPVFNKDIIIPVGVTDNMYSPSQILTYYCIISTGRECYPNINILSTNGRIEKTVNTTGNYTVSYYSIDPAKNLEEVGTEHIVVDLDIPFIALNSVEDTTNLEVSVSGWVGFDVIEVCAENIELPGTKRCIVRCELDPTASECIDETESFNFVVPLTGPRNTETTNDVIFAARDEVGNTVQEPLSVLLDLMGPAAPEGLLE